MSKPKSVLEYIQDFVYEIMKKELSERYQEANNKNEKFFNMCK